MSNTPTPINDHDLHAWVDGELAPTRYAEVEAWLAEHPEAMARVRDYQAIEQRLRQQFGAEPTQDAGLRSEATVRPLSMLARAAAAGGLMLLGGLMGWSLRDAAPVAPETAAPLTIGAAPVAVQSNLMTPAVFAHQVYAADTRYPVEIPAIQRASLNRWVSQRMHTELHAPDLSAIELNLIGGRLLPSTNRMAAQFMYEDPAGRRVTVYVRRITGSQGTGVHYSDQQALHAFYWIDDSMGYAVIGEQPAAELIAVANAVQNAFADGAGSRPAGR